jgi:hypothetical protein
MTHSSTSSHWYFTREELKQAYGTDYKAEVNARRTTVAFLQEAGIKLRQYPFIKDCIFICYAIFSLIQHIPQLTIATAIVFFHRFFVRHSLKDYDPYVSVKTTQNSLFY